MHNVFHVSLLHDWYSNGLHVDVPPVQIDSEDEYKVEGIKGHQKRNSKMQYLTSFMGYDASEDMWLNTTQLEHADKLL